MCRGRRRGILGRRVGIGAQAGAKGVVEAGRGGCALSGGADVGEGVAVGGGGDDAERLGGTWLARRRGDEGDGADVRELTILAVGWGAGGLARGLVLRLCV